MKLQSEHRCPWCGEVTDRITGPRGRLNTKKCKSCGKEYICHYNDNIFLLTDLLLVMLLITTAIAMTHIVFPVIYLVFYIAVNIFMSRISSYERYINDDDDEEEPETDEHKARFVFDVQNPNALEELKMMIFFMEKSIVPIAFTDGAGEPVSEKMYVCIEKSLRRRKIEFECDFSILPLSHVKYAIEPDSHFCFYDAEDKVTGSGNIVLKYEKLA